MGLMNELAYMQNQLGKGSLPYLGNEMRYFANQVSRGITPYANVQRPPMPGLPADYKQTELAAGAAAERFRPGAGFPGQQTAADRAYETEKSRVAQLTAQDPELQRYEKARAAAKTQEEMNAARDIGMQMWAKANPQLAAKLKPGQSGYEAIQGTLVGNVARSGQGFNMAEQLVPTPQGFPTQIPAFPGGAGYSTGFGVDTNLAPGAQTPPPYSGIKSTSELSGTGAAPLGTAATSSFGQPNVMDAEEFQKLLNMVRK